MKKMNTSFCSNMVLNNQPTFGTMNSMKNINNDILVAVDFMDVARDFIHRKIYFLDPLLKEDLSDLDEKRAGELINTEADAELKSEVWKVINRDYVAPIYRKKYLETMAATK